jgi:hypothetical protein
MQQWEYQLEIGKFEEFNDLTKRLNELGNDGWEAVGIAGDAEADNFTVLLKRVKEPQQKSEPVNLDLKRQYFDD